MTRADVWKHPPRPAVQRYRDYKDEMRLIFSPEELPENYLLVFFVPMSRSWSKKKKKEYFHQPHLATPDKDNLEKAFLDALYSNFDGNENTNDSHHYDGRVIKVWDFEGHIDVYSLPCILSDILAN